MVEAAAGKIVARGLTRRFGSKLALAPTDLEVGPGGVTGLLGPNGSGKTTLMRMLIGLTKPDAGAASVDGAALEGDGLEIRRRCAYAPGEIALYGELTGAQQLEFLLRGRERDAHARAESYARRFELPLERRVHAYSHGMKRQLLFAAALAPQVRVRILDEPSEGLDPTKRGVLVELLREDAARGTTILLSSHHLGEVDRVCQRFVFIHGGKVIATESAQSTAARARRLLRATYAPHEGLAAALARAAQELAPHVRSARVRDAELLVELADDDPRGVLERLARFDAVGAPTALEFGRASLQELYRDLYGVEAC